MKLLNCLFLLLITQSILAAPLEPIKPNFSEEIFKTLEVWRWDNKSLMINSLLGPGIGVYVKPEKNQGKSKLTDGIRFQGNFLYSSLQGKKHNSRIGSALPYSRINVTTGQKEFFKAPTGVNADYAFKFRMSPSGKYGLFFNYNYYDSNGPKIYFSDLMTGQHINKTETDELSVSGVDAYFFLSDDSAVIFNWPDGGRIVKPNGEATKFVVPKGSNFTKGNLYDYYGYYKGQELYLIDHTEGRQFILDFDKVDIKGEVSLKEEQFIYPYYYSWYFTNDFYDVGLLDAKCEWIPGLNNNHCHELQFKIGDLTFSMWNKLAYYQGPIEFNMNITKAGTVKKYQAYTKACYEADKAALPLQEELFDQTPMLPGFCFVTIVDQAPLSGNSTYTTTINFKTEGLYFKFPFALEPELAVDNKLANCRNTYSGPQGESTTVCTYEFGPITELENTRLIRAVTMKDERINGFLERKYSQEWSLVTSSGKSFPYIKKK